MDAESVDAGATTDADWRRWLKFQLEFKRGELFAAMERTGDSPSRVLRALCGLLHSREDVELAKTTVDCYCNSGGSMRGAIYKALEALTQRYCPRGTRQKLQEEMDALRKHHNMTVDAYTAAFHQLLDMYTLLSLQDGPSLSSTDVSRLYCNGMPHEWQDCVKEELREACLGIGELEVKFKRLERGERQEEHQTRKRYRTEDHSDNRREDDQNTRQHSRRVHGPGCNYCREFCYGHIYKTHNDEQCYRNPKNKNSTLSQLYVPRGKCTAVFGSGEKRHDDNEQSRGYQHTTKPVENPISSESCFPLCATSTSETKEEPQQTTTSGVSLGSSQPEEPVVKQEPTPADSVSEDPAKSAKSISGRELPKCSADAPDTGVVSANIAVKCATKMYSPPLVPGNTTVEPWKREEVILAMVGPFGQTDWSVLVFVDAATQFVELCPVVHSTSEEITHAIDQEWLSRYPWPARFVYSARVPAYDPTFSHLKSQCGSNGTLPAAEPAVSNSAFSVLLLHVHLTIELKVIDMQPQSHLDWVRVISAARFTLRSNNGAPATTTGLHSTKRADSSPAVKNMKQDPLGEPQQDRTTSTPSDVEGFPVKFAPDDMVLIEYSELRRCVGPAPRREGPYRVEAVRSNGVLVIDKGKYLEQVHVRRAVLAARY